MKRMTIGMLVAAVVSLAALLLFSGGPDPMTPAPALADVTADGEELAAYMGQMQRLAHKLGLSIDAENKDLSAFYARELGETADQIEAKFPTYEKFQISALMKAMVRPALGSVSQAIAGGNMASASSAYDVLLTSCNSCHTATQHAYLKVTRSKTNPFAQSFK